MVDRRSGDPVLASSRTCGAAMASLDTSLLARLAGARQFPANATAEVSSRNTSFLQRDRIHSDDDRHVLPHVPTKGRRKPHLYLLGAARINSCNSCLIGSRKKAQRHKKDFLKVKIFFVPLCLFAAQ